MARLAITIASWNYDRVQAIIDGRVQVEGCEVNYLALRPEETFHRAYINREFEVSEIGFSNHIIATSRGEADYVALPVFLSRLFRHSAIYIRTDRDIRGPEDLAGRKVGVPEYQMTAALWVRGMLQDLYGVKPQGIQWRQGGLESPGRKDKMAMNLPPDFPLESIGPNETLSALLARGALDALVTAAAPSCYRDGRTPIARLFEDYESAEREYFRRTGLFPIMHALAIRRDVHERHPWLASSLVKAFAEAKDLATRDLEEVVALKTTLPWVGAQARATRELMGEDFWPYGLEPNRKVLEAMTRYSHEQGLSVRKVAIEELFARSTLAQTVI
ncbi:MAG: ABC transporter substrate-binding protein [Burkholderiales bacterium]|nr:ABC transporter substrate-binding protein [Burkholderiales bacterium]